VLGSVIGLPLTILIGGAISGGAVLWAIFGPIYGIKEEDTLDTEPNNQAAE
jgi:hypothetical protein